MEHFSYFEVKIGEANDKSLALFDSLGFRKTCEVSNYFGEFELRLESVTREKVRGLLDRHGIHSYRELSYRVS